MKFYLFFISCVFTLLISLSGFCGEVPPNWPWRGMVMTSATADHTDVLKIKSMVNANLLSLHIKPRYRAKREKIDYRLALERELVWTDKILDQCKLHGITTMIVVYQFPMNPIFNLKQNSLDFWNNVEHLNEVINVAKIVSSRYADRGTELTGYQFLSEPLVKEGSKNTVPVQWPNLLDRIVKTLRQQDRDCWIAVTPGPGGIPIGYKTFVKLSYKRIIYNFHMYQPHAFTHQGVGEIPIGPKYPGMVRLHYWDKKRLEDTLTVVEIFQKKYDVPIFVGEFSAARWAEGGEQYILDLVSIFSKNEWGWAYHAYSGSHVWNPHYDNSYAPNVRADIDKDYVGTNSIRWETLKQAFKP